VAPLLTQNQLQALKSFLTDRIRDVTADAMNRVNTQLGLVTIGAQTPFEATKAVAASSRTPRSSARRRSCAPSSAAPSRSRTRRA
jgi:hypothetical protein